MAKKETDNDAPEEKEKKKSSSGNILQIIILVLLLAVLGLGGFIAWKLINLKIPLLTGQSQISQQTSQTEKTAQKPGILVELDNITVNLADTEESRFLRVKIKLEVENEKDKSKIDAFKTQIKDLIITLLSGKTFNDVRTSQGKFALKEELVWRINRFIGGRPVKNLYFSGFVAQ